MQRRRGSCSAGCFRRLLSRRERRGGRGLAPTGGKVRKDRTQRFGKLVNEKDQIEHGQYIPWARAQTPGSVKEVQFNAESRAAYLTGFRKRKAERQVVAKKTVSTKEKNEIRKGRRDRKRELMGKYEDRVAQMKKIADEAKRLEKLKELGLPLPSDDDRSGCSCFSPLSMHAYTYIYVLTSQTFCDSDDDVEEAEQEIEDESEDEELPCSTIKKVMKFGDSRTGTATTVEVREMDLSELHESAVISLALFNYDHA